MGASDLPRRALDESEIRLVVLAEIEEITAAASKYGEVGSHTNAADFRHDADILRQFLR